MLDKETNARLEYEYTTDFYYTVKRKHSMARIAHVTHRNDKSRVDPT